MKFIFTLILFNLKVPKLWIIYLILYRIQFHPCSPFRTSWREPIWVKMLYSSATPRPIQHRLTIGLRSVVIWSYRVS